MGQQHLRVSAHQKNGDFDLLTLEVPAGSLLRDPRLVHDLRNATAALQITVDYSLATTDANDPRHQKRSAQLYQHLNRLYAIIDLIEQLSEKVKPS